MQDIFGKYSNGTLDLQLQTKSGIDSDSFVENLNISIDCSNFEAIRAELLLGKEVKVDPSEVGFEKIEFRLSLFIENFPQYKWFGKYYDDYQDYFFSPYEVQEFLAECQELQSLVTSEIAVLTLRKLTYAFDRALEKNLYLGFLCD